MTEYVTSADGTRIAFERVGSGPPVVVVDASADAVAPVVAEFLS